VVRGIESSLAAAGFRITRDSVAGRQAVIARAARFGPGPMGSRQHVFVLIVVFKAGMAGRQHLDRFADEAAQYAATIRGGRGSGACAVAVAVVESAEGTAEVAWALDGLAPNTSARAFPVLVHLAAASVSCPEEPAYLRGLVRDHVAATVDARR